MRGAPPYFEKDFSTLQEVIATLRRHRDSIPGKDKKRQYLDYSRLQLGRVRIEYDSICNEIAKQAPGRNRDEILIGRLTSEPSYPRRMPVTEDHVRSAVHMVRGAGERRMLMEEAHTSDWLTATDEWESPMMAAGKILEEVVKQASPMLPGSASSTHQYAIRARELGLWLDARYVHEAERLTFLATLLGSDMKDAPWVGYVLSVFLAQPSTARRFLYKHEVRAPWERPASPGRFALLSDDDRDAIRGQLKEAIRAALVDSDDTSDFMLQILAKRFLPGPSEILGEPSEPLAE